MFEESCMKNTGLALRPVLAFSLIHAGPESPGDLDSSIVRTQEVSQYSLNHPSDVHPRTVKAAAVGKQQLPNWGGGGVPGREQGSVGRQVVSDDLPAIIPPFLI